MHGGMSVNHQQELDQHKSNLIDMMETISSNFEDIEDAYTTVKKAWMQKSKLVMVQGFEDRQATLEAETQKDLFQSFFMFEPKDPEMYSDRYVVHTVVSNSIEHRYGAERYSGVVPIDMRNTATGLATGLVPSSRMLKYMRQSLQSRRNRWNI